MNPITQIRSRLKQRKEEVYNNIPYSASYHSQYKNSAYVYAGQLSFKLTEGDLLAVFSEYGEVVDVNLVRDKQSGDSRGFAFIAYEDQRSTDVAVDNLNGVSIAGRLVAVDHILDYKRLVENEAYNGDEAQMLSADAVPKSSKAEEWQVGQVLAGAEAEAAEDDIGTTTTGQAGAAGGAARDGRGTAAAVPLAASGAPLQPWEADNSVAALLRGAENMMAKMSRDRKQQQQQQQQRRPQHMDDEDPLAMMRSQDPLESMRPVKRQKAEKAAKKEKKGKDKKNKHGDRQGPAADAEDTLPSAPTARHAASPTPQVPPSEEPSGTYAARDLSRHDARRSPQRRAGGRNDARDEYRSGRREDRHDDRGGRDRRGDAGGREEQPGRQAARREHDKPWADRSRRDWEQSSGRDVGHARDRHTSRHGGSDVPW